jgi:hypothetical protein
MEEWNDFRPIRRCRGSNVGGHSRWLRLNKSYFTRENRRVVLGVARGVLACYKLRTVFLILVIVKSLSRVLVCACAIYAGSLSIIRSLPSFFIPKSLQLCNRLRSLKKHWHVKVLTSGQLIWGHEEARGLGIHWFLSRCCHNCRIKRAGNYYCGAWRTTWAWGFSMYKNTFN